MNDEATPAQQATLPTKQRAHLCIADNCRTVTIELYCSWRHRHLASAHTADRPLLNNGDDRAKNG